MSRCLGSCLIIRTNFTFLLFLHIPFFPIFRFFRDLRIGPFIRLHMFFLWIIIFYIFFTFIFFDLLFFVFTTFFALVFTFFFCSPNTIWITEFKLFPKFNLLVFNPKKSNFFNTNLKLNDLLIIICSTLISISISLTLLNFSFPANDPRMSPISWKFFWCFKANEFST